ncbi:unnamed protein product [Bursaphelenchus xylophilus]|uniref:(pine wood nematode) hypothetical protein n=1 Tax=Bursaphelenchus xylophilus TaxID=6326 RepID=A0A1I7RU19_BURXY|nr:unnamed protein product [Bursaphelenchus xylophilus]CAG9132015.1 unnamed protein product [Bursaphelenchus xylophilus]
MEEAAIRALVNSLLICSAAFEGLQPNAAELKVFEFKDGGIQLQTFNWNESFVSETVKIVFNGTIEGANVQMVVNGEKIELGGQVSSKDSDGIVKCPVAGDTNEIRVVTRSTLCDADYYAYRVQDKLYGLANKADKFSFIFGVDGSLIERVEMPLAVDDKLGVDQTRGTLVYKDGDGKCQELTAGPLDPPWEPKPCGGEMITLVANEASAWHHVQYLEVRHNCLNSTIPGDQLKNVYVRFLSYGDVESTTEFDPNLPLFSAVEKVYIGLAVAGVVLLVAISFLSGHYAVNRKKYAAWFRKRLGKKKMKEEETTDEETKQERKKMEKMRGEKKKKKKKEEETKKGPADEAKSASEEVQL